MPDKKLFSTFARGIRKDGGLQRGSHWVGAQRGFLSFYEDRLRMGSWTIPYESIQSAVLYKLNGLLGGYLLEIRTPDGPYSFGVMSSGFWKSDLPFPVERREGEVQSSTTSQLYRLGLLIAWIGLMYYLFVFRD